MSAMGKRHGQARSKPIQPEPQSKDKQRSSIIEVPVVNIQEH
ncbi:hypothetical protein SynA18461_00600 [Synechococcus sp. A18-46.1]|nr:hypothetical protein SynA18461_00600 [Synechococcus sp. A18-46.1]QNJ16124.1 hypothetical protein SynA1840_00573 [Synechococcus sp. A18-40]